MPSICNVRHHAAGEQKENMIDGLLLCAVCLCCASFCITGEFPVSMLQLKGCFLCRELRYWPLICSATIGEVEFLLYLNRIIPIPNCRAFFCFLSGDMKKRTCPVSLHFTHVSCPKESAVFLEQHLPLSFSCHQISKSYPIIPSPSLMRQFFKGF